MENKRVDYSLINAAKNEDGRIGAMQDEVRRCGYISLTDALAHPDMCGPVMLNYLQDEELRNVRSHNEHRWKILVIRDEWGRAPFKGGKVTRRIMKPLVDRAKRPLRSNVINDMKRRGSFEKEFIETREFEIDDKGCIDCSYDDAVFFLQQYGVHFETRHALCGRREMSSGPSRAPDGSLKHVWYWRYEEVPPWLYSQLAKLKKS